MSGQALQAPAAAPRARDTAPVPHPGAARTTPAPRPPRRRFGLTGYAFVAFPLAVLLVFTLIPTLAGLLLSFFDWSGGALWTPDTGWRLPAFVGLANYERLLADRDIRHGLVNTFAFVLCSVPPTVLFAFLLAVALDAEWFRGRTLVRTVIFMPTIVSIVAIGFVWRWFLNDSDGALNWFLRAFGWQSPPSWLTQGYWPLFWIIAVQVWRGVGFCLVLYLAALQGVSRSLYEAAALDGAGRLQTIRHITWPSVRPMTAFLVVTGVIGALQVFDLVFVMTGRSATTYTTVLNLEVYEQFKVGSYGYAAAIGALIFVITIAATAVQLLAFSPRRAVERRPARRPNPGSQA